MLLILCHWRNLMVARMLWLDLSGTGVGVANVLVGWLGSLRLEPIVREAFSHVVCNCNFSHSVSKFVGMAVTGRLLLLLLLRFLFILCI